MRPPATTFSRRCASTVRTTATRRTGIWCISACVQNNTGRRRSPTNRLSRSDGRPPDAVGLCDARRGGHRHGSDRGRSRGPHLARGRGALGRLADRAAQASSRLCACAGRESRHSARARGPQGVYPRAVGPEKCGSHASCGHIDRVCQRKWMARQRYLSFFFLVPPFVVMDLFGY